MKRLRANLTYFQSLSLDMSHRSGHQQKLEQGLPSCVVVLEPLAFLPSDSRRSGSAKNVGIAWGYCGGMIRRMLVELLFQPRGKGTFGISMCVEPSACGLIRMSGRSFFNSSSSSANLGSVVYPTRPGGKS